MLEKNERNNFNNTTSPEKKKKKKKKKISQHVFHIAGICIFFVGALPHQVHKTVQRPPEVGANPAITSPRIISDFI